MKEASPKLFILLFLSVKITQVTLLAHPFFIQTQLGIFFFEIPTFFKIRQKIIREKKRGRWRQKKKACDKKKLLWKIIKKRKIEGHGWVKELIWGESKE